VDLPNEPVVVATGDTVTLVHTVYTVLFPDGSVETLIPAQCKRDAGDELAWAYRWAHAEWATRRGQHNPQLDL